MNIEIKELTDEMAENLERMNLDAVEHLERKNCHGLAAFEKGAREPMSSLFWEYKGVEEENEVTAELICMDFADGEAGSMLVDEFSKIIRSEDVSLTEVEIKEADAALQKLMENKGFDLKPQESRKVVLSVADLKEMSLVKKEPPDYIIGIEELSSREFKQIILKCIWNHHKGVFEDIINIPMYWFDTQVSCCLRTDNRVSGIFLVHCTPSGVLMPVLLFAEGADARMNILNMMRYTVRKAIEYFEPRTKIVVIRNTDATARVIEKMFPDKKGEAVVFGTRMEGA